MCISIFIYFIMAPRIFHIGDLYHAHNYNVLSREVICAYI